MAENIRHWDKKKLVTRLRKKPYKRNTKHSLKKNGYKYFGHLALQTGSANAIANGIFGYISAD